jgi:phosphoribosylformimino-5-aminoimidazole carboxamide ribotide isomerase
MIVFPAIDLRRGRCVRLRQGRAEAETVYSDDPATVARQWVAEGAEWLHIVNLDGAFGDAQAAGQRTINLQRLAEIHRSVPETPVQFGGGLRTLADVETALNLGATRIVLGTVAVEDPDLVARAVQRYGAERIVVGIDAREGQVAIRGWRRTSDTTATALGQVMRSKGAVRAVYTDITRDGMLTGVNVEATAALARTTGLRVIASGGVASLADVQRLRGQRDAFEEPAGEGLLEGVIIGQALYAGALALPAAIQAARG